MKNENITYEKQYIFVDSVRIPLAFMDCKKLSEQTHKKKYESRIKEDTRIDVNNSGEKTELLDTK